MSLVLRNGKGSPLSWAEMDANLTYLQSLASNGGAQELSAILAEGNTTNGRSIILSQGDQIKGEQSNFLLDLDFDLEPFGETGRAFSLGSLDPLQPNAHLFISDPGEQGDASQLLVAKNINLIATDGIDSSSILITPQGVQGLENDIFLLPRLVQSNWCSVVPGGSFNDENVSTGYAEIPMQFGLLFSGDGTTWGDSRYVKIRQVNANGDTINMIGDVTNQTSYHFPTNNSGYLLIDQQYIESLPVGFYQLEIGFFEFTEQHCFCELLIETDGTSIIGYISPRIFVNIDSFNFFVPNLSYGSHGSLYMINNNLNNENYKGVLYSLNGVNERIMKIGDRSSFPDVFNMTHLLKIEHHPNTNYYNPHHYLVVEGLPWHPEMPSQINRFKLRTQFVIIYQIQNG